MAKKKKIKIPKSVVDLKLSPKKYAKKHNIRISGKHLSKRERKHNVKKLQKEYSESAISGLNKAVKIIAENPDAKKIEKVKSGIDNIILNPDVMKRIAKIYKKNPDSYHNLIFLPHMIMNTLLYYEQESISDEEKAIGSALDKEALVEFCEKILNKQIKRYKKLGMDQATAYSLATTIPTARLFRNNRHWYRILIMKMYDMAESTSVDIDRTLVAVLKVDKKRPIEKKDFLYGFFGEFILQRTTNKSAKWNANQKELHEGLIERALAYMNGLKKSKLRAMLKQYIKIRKTAEEYKNDGKRVIKFTDHANSNSPYTRIKDVVQDLIADNSTNELYLQ
jgi:hypothetical protein